MQISNIVMEVFAIETVVLRLKKKNSGPHTDVAHTYINDAMSRVAFSAEQVLAAIAEGEALRTQLASLRKLLSWTPINTVSARQRIADFLIDSNRYAL